MKKPIIKFNAILPGKLGILVGQDWQAVTIPPIGIFFRHVKDKVSTKLFKHECCHWRQGTTLGPLFYPVLFLDYGFQGYNKSVLEKQANEYEKKPLTKEEQAWWDVAK